MLILVSNLGDRLFHNFFHMSDCVLQRLAIKNLTQSGFCRMVIKAEIN
jgi:hypothetical protein